jgi:hypothetical protein
MENFEKFSSKDFYLSAVLMACDCKLQRLEKFKDNFVTFVFKKPPENCHEIIASYWADELQVNPRKLISAINQLKTRLHQGI